MQLNYSQLRARARAILGDNLFAGAWLFPFLAGLIVSLIYGIASSFAVLGIIVYGPLYLGLASYFLGVSRRHNSHDNLTPLFDGFRYEVGTSVIIGILVPIFTFLWSLLFIIPGMVKSFSYAMTFYIKRDHPEYTATQAITASRELMDGHKLDLFCLRFFFIGWVLLSILTFGIGFIWVTPYIQAAETAFYEEICFLKGGKFTPAYMQVNNNESFEQPSYGEQSPEDDRDNVQ